MYIGPRLTIHLPLDILMREHPLSVPCPAGLPALLISVGGSSVHVLDKDNFVECNYQGSVL